MRKKPLVTIVILVVAIVAIFFGVFFYYKLHKLQTDYSAKQEQEKALSLLKEKNNLVSKVSGLYLFPEGEIPTIATVSDPLLLKGQAFFLTSEVGDKVLIFSKAGKAILYRPSVNKIVDIVLIQSNSKQ